MSRSALWSTRTAERFYDEGEDLWPKRYAIWGRLVAQQPDQIAYSIIDSKVLGHFMPSVFPPIQGASIAELAAALGLPVDRTVCAVEQFNQAVVPGRFDPTVLDDCRTDGLEPAKSHWAQRMDTPPFFGYPLRPGITFTYLGVRVGQNAAVRMKDGTLEQKHLRGGGAHGREHSRQRLSGGYWNDHRHRVRTHRGKRGGKCLIKPRV